MGKKSRSKRQQQKQKHNLQVSGSMPMGTTPASLSGSGEYVPEVAASGKPAQLLDVQTEYIRADIVRIVLLVVVLALILSSLYVLNTKTNYLRDAGDRLSIFLRL